MLADMGCCLLALNALCSFYWMNCENWCNKLSLILYNSCGHCHPTVVFLLQGFIQLFAISICGQKFKFFLTGSYYVWWHSLVSQQIFLWVPSAKYCKGDNLEIQLLLRLTCSCCWFHIFPKDLRCPPILTFLGSLGANQPVCFPLKAARF